MNEEQNNDLLSLINKMNSTVNSQIKSSYDEIKNQTKRLTWHDQLVSDDLLLKIEPSILRSSMTEDEYLEFIKKYPDYELSYSIENSDVMTINEETKIQNPELISEDFSLSHQIDTNETSKKSLHSESENKLNQEINDNGNVTSEAGTETETETEIEKDYEVSQKINEYETDNDEYEYEEDKINIKSILAWSIITIITTIGLWLILK